MSNKNQRLNRKLFSDLAKQNRKNGKVIPKMEAQPHSGRTQTAHSGKQGERPKAERYS